MMEVWTVTGRYRDSVQGLHRMEPCAPHLTATYSLPAQGPPARTKIASIRRLTRYIGSPKHALRDAVSDSRSARLNMSAANRTYVISIITMAFLPCWSTCAYVERRAQNSEGAAWAHAGRYATSQGEKSPT